MKAEHRKELETNKLADKIGGVINSFKEGPSRNATIYGSLVLVAIMLVIIYFWVAANAKAADSARWLKLDSLDSVKSADDFIKENPDTEQARLARLQVARLDLLTGTTNLDSITKSDAIKGLRRAAESYEKLANESASTPLLVQESLLNAAQARETLGEYDRAKQLYERLSRDFPQSLKGKAAADAVKKLDEYSGAILDQLKRLASDTASEPVKLPPLR
jgi:tetratricopeptide (TPR) repeat protein